MKRVVIAAVVLVALLVVAIAWKIHAQNEALEGPPGGSGIVESEGVDVSARLGARVLRVGAEEGAEVQEGAVLIELECDEP
ncbi:MAG: hemolysin D, partial [Sandaracinaceae bacterium]|nr:hemolysin D [Sandaracinaceae bacterium]